MKNLNFLVWLTQLGLSIAIPPVGFILVAVWLQDRFSLGSWVMIAGVIMGVIGAADGLRTSLKAMDRMAREKEDRPPPVSFNDHD